MNQPAVEAFGNKIRLRVCGLCFQHDKVLLVNHQGLYNRDFWAPPGGGVEFGESLESALKREFLEECGVVVEMAKFLFICQFIREPLHAVELFYEVKIKGTPTTGSDPELPHKIIHEVRFLEFNEVSALEPNSIHGIFHRVASPSDLINLTGIFSLT